MHSTDEVWVAGKEETSIALMDFGQSDGVEVLVWVFGLVLVSQKLGCRWRSATSSGVR